MPKHSAAKRHLRPLTEADLAVLVGRSKVLGLVDEISTMQGDGEPRGKNTTFSAETREVGRGRASAGQATATAQAQAQVKQAAGSRCRR